MSDDKSPNGDKSVTTLEKVATAVAGLLVAFFVGVLVWDAAHPDVPPLLSVEVKAPRMGGSHYQLPATVRNRGDKSAKDVIVHLALVSAETDSTIDESDVTIDWLPGQSSREIVGMFARPSNSEQAVMRAQVRAYVVP